MYETLGAVLKNTATEICIPPTRFTTYVSLKVKCETERNLIGKYIFKKVYLTFIFFNFSSFFWQRRNGLVQSFFNFASLVQYDLSGIFQDPVLERFQYVLIFYKLVPIRDRSVGDKYHAPRFAQKHYFTV